MSSTIATIFPRPVSVAFGKALLSLLATALVLLSTASHAGFITFNGTQTWLNEGDGLGTWYVDGHRLWQFDFFVTEAGSYEFQASPAFYTSPLDRQYDPFARLYNGSVREFGTVATTYFPTSLFLNAGNYAMVFGFGGFNSDAATEGLFNYGIASGSPAPFEDIDFTITISGPGISVPEPGSLILLMIGLIGVLTTCRRSPRRPVGSDSSAEAMS
ncbi:MAG: PEP-CTERM sorting domain-containing protein [Alcanivoracaceae bacterium]